MGKLDKVIDGVLRNLFDRLNGLPKEAIIAQRYSEQMSELQTQLTSARATHQAHSAEMLEYETEVIKVIRGESKINSDLLNKLYEEAKEKTVESEQAVQRLEEKLKSGEAMKSALSGQFDNLQTWSDMFDECGIETKKMIVSHIIKAVRVSRDYEVEIDLSIACEELGVCLGEAETVAEPMEKSA